MIYFDMDGVLVDFCKSASKIEAPTKSQFWKQVKKIGVDFWLNMDEIPETRDLVQKYLNNGEEISVLSKLPYTDTGSAFIGKSLWLEKHYPGVFHTVILTKGFKGKFCKPGDILYDDHQENIDDWIKNGGLGIYIKKEK